MFLFPFEDVHTRNHESFPINFRSSPVTIDDTSHLAATVVQEVPADSGNFPWYMTDSIAVLEDSYSEVVVNVIDLALNWQLFHRLITRTGIGNRITWAHQRHTFWRHSSVQRCVMATGAERLMQTVQAVAGKPKIRVICGFFGPVRDWVSCFFH